MIKGAIFDVDGTLLDTMGMWRGVAAHYLGALGVQADSQLGAKFFEMTLPESAKLLREEYGLPYTVAEIIQGIQDIAVDAYREECQLMPGAGAFLRALHEDAIPMTVVSSGSEGLIRAAFTRLGIVDYFTHIYASTETGISKREATMFLSAAAVMGSEPKETWVFEDAYYAAAVAKSAGFRTIGIADQASRGHWGELERETEAFWHEYPAEIPALLRD